MADAAASLRALVLDIRRKPVPIFNIIPTLDAGATEIEALRARVAELEAGEASKRGIMLAQASRLAELEGDLNVARLQLSARVCSECPARARLAELEADAARYRWLRDRNTGQDKIASARIVVDDGHPPCWELKHGDDLDRAIDAARLPGNKTEVLK